MCVYIYVMYAYIYMYMCICMYPLPISNETICKKSALASNVRLV